MKRLYEEGSSGQEENASLGHKRLKRRDRYFWSGHRELDFLTNGFKSKFDIDGATFFSVSRYMWYMRAKTWRPNDDLAGLIREASDEEKAKQLSRRCTSSAPGLVQVWMETRLRVMAKAVMRKFECSEDLRQRLVSTGRDRLLLASRYDPFYGIGFTMKEAVERVDEWGHNYLGDMLMLVRLRLNERVTR